MPTSPTAARSNWTWAICRTRPSGATRPIFLHREYPERYSHVALRPIRRVDLIWQGEEVRQYEKLKSDAAKSGLEIPQFVKDVLTKTLGSR